MSDKEICKLVLEQLLDISIKRLEVPTGQKVIDLLTESKGVRLDVYVNDERGTLEDVSEELIEFFRYIESSTDATAASSKSELVKRVHEKVREIKASRELEVEYMTLMQRDRENIRLGEERGEKRGKEVGARMMQLRFAGSSYEKIAQEMNMNETEVESFLKQYES